MNRVGSSLWSYDTGWNSLMVNEESTDDEDERFQTSDQLVWKHVEPLVCRYSIDGSVFIFSFHNSQSL